MRESGEVMAAAAVAVESDADASRVEERRAEVGPAGPGLRATRPGPLARLAARRRVVSADLARIAAAMRLAAQHEE